VSDHKIECREGVTGNNLGTKRLLHREAISPIVYHHTATVGLPAYLYAVAYGDMFCADMVATDKTRLIKG
jgi:hypothetical protein